MLKARTKLTPTSARTREQLILAGERLFAEQGIDNVSLRQINAEAGQRNSSASHYHFGSKESLVTAIYEYRIERLNARRQAMLAALPPTAEPRPVAAVIGLLVQPIVEEIEESEGGRNAIRFVAQLVNHPTLNLVTMWRQQFEGSLGRIHDDLRVALPEIPDEVFGSRFALTCVLTVNALADRERPDRGATDVLSHTLPDLYITNLNDVLVGVMSAPVSANTHAGIKDLRAMERRPTVPA
jgi:AcrR family transcriptional regulator